MFDAFVADSRWHGSQAGFSSSHFVVVDIHMFPEFFAKKLLFNLTSFACNLHRGNFHGFADIPSHE